MKNNSWILYSILFSMLSSCSVEDIAPNLPLVEVKKFKKMESFADDNLLWLDREIIYSDQLISSLIVKTYDYVQSTYTVNYTNNKISSISLSLDYDNSTSSDRIINYEAITVEDGKITLMSDDNDVSIITIRSTSGYVDSIMLTFPDYPNYSFEQKIVRDAGDNIESLTNVDTGETSQKFTYSHFDNGRQYNPVNPIIEVQWTDLIQLFNLKISRDNPTKSYLHQSSPTSVYSAVNYTYDDYGYITSGLFETFGTELNYVYEYY